MRRRLRRTVAGRRDQLQQAGSRSAENPERPGASERRVTKTIDLGEYRAPHDVRWVDGTRVVVTSEANQALLLVNITSGAVERVFRTEAGVSHMLALSTDRTRLYCSNMKDGSVSAFDFKTGNKIADVKTGKEAEGVGVTPDGRWVWVGNRAEDTISIIDTRALEVTKRIPRPDFRTACSSRRMASSRFCLTRRRRRWLSPTSRRRHW